jgi:nifR3 family TIM-barrel protein
MTPKERLPAGSHHRPIRIGALLLPGNLFLAPLAGITDLPFRSVTRPMGCALAFTEMVSASGLVVGDGGSRRYITTDRCDRPLGVQLFGSKPEILREAVRYVTGEIDAALIDFNMGCPARKVLRSGCGAALLKDPAGAARILEALRKATPLPLTVKIRSGWSRSAKNHLEIGRIAESSGVDAVTLHPRTADQGFSGAASWEDIGELRANLSIPVIGSGDILGPADAERMFSETGCDAVMIGRGALGNPWIFRRTRVYLETGETPPPPSAAERLPVLLDHFEKNLAFYGERIGIRTFRKHLAWYSRGLPGGAAFRRRAFLLEDRDTLLAEMKGFFEPPVGESPPEPPGAVGEAPDTQEVTPSWVRKA